MSIGRFWGDYEHEDPQDFLYQVEQLVIERPDVTDALKLHAFKLHLKNHSEADLWCRALPITQKDTWEHLCIAFEKEWPMNAITLRIPTPSSLEDIPEPNVAISPTGTPPFVATSQIVSHSLTATSTMTTTTPPTTTTSENLTAP
jgi:hypothetical protein